MTILTALTLSQEQGTYEGARSSPHLWGVVVALSVICGPVAGRGRNSRRQQQALALRWACERDQVLQKTQRLSNAVEGKTALGELLLATHAGSSFDASWESWKQRLCTSLGDGGPAAR